MISPATFKTHLSLFNVMQMDMIVDSPDGTVSSLNIINASADLEKRMNITHAEELIERLIQDKWMSKVRLSMLI